VLIATHRRLRRWRGRLGLVWGLLALCALVAAMHMPAGTSQGMDDGEHHMDGAALCLAVLAATGLLVGIAVASFRPRPRPARRLGRSRPASWPYAPLPPVRAGPLALQVLRL
jgi:hypothetical protein